MKIKRLLSAVLCLAMVIGLVSAISLTANAAVCSKHYIIIEGGNVKVGDVITLRESAYLQDLDNGSDYGVQNTYSYSVSDSSIAEITGNKLKFLKQGNVTLNIKHTQTFEKTKKTSTHTDTVNFTVKIDSSVPSGNGVKVYVGQTVSLPVGPENDYEPAYNNYTFSEEGFADSIGNGKITFLKPGTLTVTNSWQLWDGENPKPRTGTITKTYDIYYPEEIPETTIKLTSEPFIGGGIFPDFKIANSGDYRLSEATFYAEMCDYYVGDRLPYYREGTEIDYIRITIKPDKGYIFAFDGDEDGKAHDTTKYKVEYNGKTYDANVVHSYGKNELWCYVKATVASGTVYHTTISDLEPPYHKSELDKEITTHADVEPVSIRYTMFNKELTDFSNGDNIAIVVRLKTNGKNKFLEDSKVYWKEQQVYSDVTNLISENEAEFVFQYRVGVKDEQIIRWADFTIPGVYVGETLPENAFSATDGITVKSVTWTPNDEKVDANKEYTVKIEFEKKAEFIYASDFAEQGVVHINGERAKFVDESTTKGKFSNIKYFAEATFKPVAVVYTDTPGGTTTTTTTTTETTTETWVTGTIVGTATTESSDKEETNKEDDKETGKDEAATGSSSGGSSEDKADTYQFTFTDVEETQWYYASVQSAHKMGLISGKSETTYCPGDNMTFAEAVKLAACMNILYNGGDPNKDIAPGDDVWYSTFMEYALDNGIIDEDLTPKANEKITRKEYVYIFSKALPEKAFEQKNNIPSGSIPDVKEEEQAQDKAIYLLYRAGILTGNDSKGTFNPAGNITRAEVAAILIRMMDETARVGAPKDLAK